MREHKRVMLASIGGGASEDYTVPAGYRDVVSSVVLANDAIAADAHYKISVTSGVTTVVLQTALVGGTAYVMTQPWVTLEAGDTLTVENTGGGGGPDLHTTVGVLRYTL